MKERIPLIILFYCRIEQAFIFFPPEQTKYIAANAPENLVLNRILQYVRRRYKLTFLHLPIPCTRR